jgi:hypothetical protein
VRPTQSILVVALVLAGCAGAPSTVGRWARSADAIRPEAVALLSRDDLGETPIGGFGIEAEGAGEAVAAKPVTPEEPGAAEGIPDGGAGGPVEEELGFENEFPAGLGLRFGAIGYLESTTDDVSPRALLGAYCHFGESETTRFEAGVDFTPDVENAGDSYYVVADLHFTGFIGSSGSVYYRLGGGGIFETRGKTTATVGMLDVGGGVWVRVNEKTGIFAGVTAQFPVGEELNVPVVVLVSGGVDF